MIICPGCRGAGCLNCDDVGLIEEYAMNMIERVARELATKHYCDRFNKQAGHPQILANVNANWHIFAGTVRIVIEAMREPSDRMLLAGTNYDPDNKLKSQWWNMIDAALKE